MTTDPRLDDHELEQRLREHYVAAASELRLADVTLADVLARGDVPVTAAASTPPRRGWIAGSVAAALVAGAVIGASVVLVAGDDERPAAGPTVLPHTQPPGSPGAPFRPCPDAAVPDDLAELEIQNDIRVANVLLPAQTPEGYCPADHNVASLNGIAGGEYAVWTDCGECERPAAAIASVFVGVDLERSFETGDFESVDVNGLEGHYFAPDDANPLGRLYVDTGPDAALTLIGWGLDADGFVRAATGLTGDDESANEVTGMQLVYDRTLGAYAPGLMPFASTIDVWYDDDDGSTSLRYAVLDYEEQPPLEAYAWVMPEPSFTTVDGTRRVTFPAAPSYGGFDSTVVITQVDQNTQVLWSSTGEAPTPAEELAAIELTPADVNDPRWLEIAWESGQYGAVG